MSHDQAAPLPHCVHDELQLLGCIAALLHCSPLNFVCCHVIAAQNAANDALLTCTVELNIEKDMNGPLYVYVEIDGMYQNHRR
jgi:hypothetical protein